MNENTKKINELTDGSIGKQLLRFFFPILFGTFFQQLYNTIDAIVVGRFVGSNALAAVGGSSGMIVNLIVVLDDWRFTRNCYHHFCRTKLWCRQI